VQRSDFRRYLKMNTKLGLFVVAFLVVSSGMTSAWADTSCVVSDPTGTRLNVRSPRNGPILGGAASRSSSHGRQDQIPPPPSLSG
jgi:hypothetical protein